MPGNLLVWFDDGRVGRTRKVSPSLLLYWPNGFFSNRLRPALRSSAWRASATPRQIDCRCGSTYRMDASLHADARARASSRGKNGETVASARLSDSRAAPQDPPATTAK